MQNYVFKTNKIIEELFYMLASAWLIFNILEFVWPGIVIAYININVILLFWLIIGILKLISTSENTN